jgi:endo-1,4-beta-xylanase
MKWERIHPELGVYDFEAADALVEFSNKNDHFFFTGHTLVWHSQVPDWVFEHKDGTPLNRAELLKHGMYEDGTLRESKWQSIIGDDFMEHAFVMAAKAAPNAKLYYNDYNLYKPKKREGVVNFLKRLQAKGIKIDGVGMQAHYSLTSPELTDIENSIKAYKALNISVLITELDVSVIAFHDEDNMGADVSLNIERQTSFDCISDNTRT